MTGSAVAPATTGGATGLPHAQGRTGGAYACVRRHTGQRTGTGSPTVNPLSFGPIVHPTGLRGWAFGYFRAPFASRCADLP
ncbi:hypothetical protein ACIRQY_00040 [Streptomyces sp. NPDC101490]|uniref:hypothetical protein n=1 Tax=Streptomyces sp. NPDC101490 TaxID=3366143 RepID=UPI00381E6A37